ncbi:MAG: IS66 family transposase [Deltaproteobacteria bacterium]|nr:IS66 family transposase [Deltaproteobacteria bacterium]
MTSIENLPDDVAQLKNLAWDYYQQTQWLQQRIDLLQSALFCPKSEKSKKLLSNYTLPLPIERVEAPEPTVQEEPPTEEVKTYTRVKRGRRPLPENLPRIDVVHDLSEEEKVCSCGACLKRIGEEVCEKLDYVPATMRVERHVRFKYACPACDGQEGSPVVHIASVPPQIIPKGLATPGLLAQIMAAKLVDAIPFYRQNKQFARLGVDMSRNCMSAWALHIAHAFPPLLGLFQKEIRSGPVINMDDTTLQVLSEPGRSNTSKSYLWLFRGGDPDRPTVVFRYEPSRASRIPKNYLGNYTGYIQTDGYIGYQALGASDGITHVGCMVHIRRKFKEVQKITSKKTVQGTAKEILVLIERLYKIEHEIKEHSPNQKVEVRLEKSLPVLNSMRAILDERAPLVPPSSLLAKAIAYARNQWPKTVAYVHCGLLTPDNNLAENAIRPIALGRKNWLFCGGPKGAEASAAFFSLIETAKANNIQPQAYLKFLFERLPLAASENDLREIMPQYLDRSLLPQFRNTAKA